MHKSPHTHAQNQTKRHQGRLWFNHFGTALFECDLPRTSSIGLRLKHPYGSRLDISEQKTGKMAERESETRGEEEHESDRSLGQERTFTGANAGTLHSYTPKRYTTPWSKWENSGDTPCLVTECPALWKGTSTDVTHTCLRL